MQQFYTTCALVCLHGLSCESLHTDVLLAPMISPDSATFAASFFSLADISLSLPFGNTPSSRPYLLAEEEGQLLPASSLEINLTPMISPSLGGVVFRGWGWSFFCCCCFSFRPATAPHRRRRLLILQLEHSWCSRPRRFLPKKKTHRPRSFLTNWSSAISNQ